MVGRRTEILDRALHVLAEHGMRGLTHRAVDAGAGLPAGSTSYYFRTRAALVGGCVRRLVDLDLAIEVPAAQQASGAGVRAGVDAFVDALTAIGVAMATTQRHRTLARYELSLAASRDADLRAVLASAGDIIRRRGAVMLAALGAADPGAAAAELAAVLDGMVLTALVRGPYKADALASWLRPTLDRAVRAQPGIAP